MMSSTFALCVVTFCALLSQINGDDIAWKNKGEVDVWFNQVVNPAVSACLNGPPGKDGLMKLAEKVGMADDFTEYIMDQAVEGKEAWMEFAADIPAFIKSVQIYFDVELWHPRHALVSFVYFEEFIDDTKLTVKGKVMVIRNEKGELAQWTYFSKDGTIEAMMQKVNELAKKNEL